MQEKTKAVVELIERQLLHVNGVNNVDVFDEEKIILKTDLGNLVIKGSHMNLTNLDVENGCLQVDGMIDSLEYQAEKRKWLGKGRKK